MEIGYKIINDLINIYSDKYGKSILSETLSNPENCPKIFYRYVNAENARKFIIDSYPWLTHPKYYTDKYDGKWYDILDSPDYSEEEREILEGFRNYFKNYFFIFYQNFANALTLQKFVKFSVNSFSRNVF